jgi:hypothetical protein
MKLFLSFNSADRTSVIAVQKAVVGSSGSDKSSVVQAGLLPLAAARATAGEHMGRCQLYTRP